MQQYYIDMVNIICFILINEYLMSHNPDVIYIFVKGNKGRGAFVITNSTGIPLCQKIVEDLETELSPIHADWAVINKALEYVKVNINKNGIPKEPVIFVFTTYENVYQVLAHIKNPESDKYKRYFKQTEDLKKLLERRSLGVKIDDNVKFQYVPEGFVNKIPDLVRMLGESKKNRLKP
jgi:hypothetical protein